MVTPEDLKRLYKINKDVQEYFESEFLKKKESLLEADILSYNKLEYPTLKRFFVGYAPVVGNGFLNYFKDKGYTMRDLLEFGLVESGAGGKCKLEGRLTFPLFNGENQIVGFTSIGLDRNYTPKVLITGPNVYFDSKRYLFGIRQAKETKEDYFIACQDDMSVLLLSQGGIDNAVACLAGPNGYDFWSRDEIQKYKKKVLIALNDDDLMRGERFEALVHLRLSRGNILKTAPLLETGIKNITVFLKENGAEALKEKINTISFE